MGTFMGINRWTVGDVIITRIDEIETPGLDPEMILYGTSREHVLGFSWLTPNYADAEGALIYSVHAFVVETSGKRIIVDTCIGNHKVRNLPNFNQLDEPFLDRLAAAGYQPDDIDFVLCTHLHVDHVGWNTRLVDGTWVPTFPNARYLFGRVEWSHWQNDSHGLGDVFEEHAHAILDVPRVVEDSIRPIIDAELHDLVEADHHITGEVELFSTPGHTPGHVSVRIRSRGKEAIITGDMIHHPLQVADPSVGSWTDFNRGLARSTRTEFLASIADQPTLVLGTHFPTPCGGHVVRIADGYVFAPHVNLIS